MTEMKSDSNGKKEPGNASKDKKKKKKFRTLLPPAGVGKLSREEIREAVKAVIAQRKASE